MLFDPAGEVALCVFEPGAEAIGGDDQGAEGGGGLLLH